MEPPKPRIRVDWKKQLIPRRFTVEEWENQRHIFTRMYHQDNLKLSEIMKVMAQEHGFCATKRQFDRKIKQWGLDKNLKKKEALAMLKIQERREKEGKSTIFEFSGNPVTQEKLMWHTESHTASECEPVPSPVATPNFVDYWTPKTCGPETPNEYETPMGSDTPHVVTTDLYPPLHSPGACDPERPSGYATPNGGDTPRAMTVDCSPRPSFSQLGDTQNVRRCSPNANTYPLHPAGEDVQMKDAESPQPKAVSTLDLVSRGQNESYPATDPQPSQGISQHLDDATHAMLVDLLQTFRSYPTCIVEMKEKALRLASSQGHVIAVRLLVEEGTDISAADSTGRTPLHMAAYNGHKPVVQLLHENGEDVSARDLSSCTPLHLAALSGHETVVRLLLENGAEVSAKDSDSDTPLHLAASGGYDIVVRLLLENGADVAAKSTDSVTPLHLAASKGHETVVRLLLENSADVPAKNLAWETLLHKLAASYWPNEAASQLLPKEGTSPLIQNNCIESSIQMTEDLWGAPFAYGDDVTGYDRFYDRANVVWAMAVLAGPKNFNFEDISHSFQEL